jgi:SAM-dependent methyltransferase
LSGPTRIWVCKLTIRESTPDQAVDEKTVVSGVRELLRSSFGWTARRKLLTFITGDDAPAWRRHEYKRKFGRKLIRGIMASDSPPWARVVMIAETHRLVAALHPERLETLEISGQTWRDFGFKSYRTADYPEFDICEKPLREQFDLIIAEQVFEHLLWPYRAGKNVFEMLRPGGYFHISTPFLFPIHDAPVDCSRWTELGLKYFLAECGFPLETCVTGSWGNPACVKRYLKWGARYRSWRHSLKNDPSTPITVWAVARKPVA